MSTANNIIHMVVFQLISCYSIRNDISQNRIKIMYKSDGGLVCVNMLPVCLIDQQHQHSHVWYKHT